MAGGFEGGASKSGSIRGAEPTLRANTSFSAGDAGRASLTSVATGKRVRVTGFNLTVATSDGNEVTLNSSGTVATGLSGRMEFNANTAGIMAPGLNPDGWFETLVDEDFVVSSNTTGSLSITYKELL